MTSLFPMFIKLNGRQVLVVGAGKVGEPKIGGLLETGARIRVVALEATPKVREWARSGGIELQLRAFANDDLEGALLVVAVMRRGDLQIAVSTAGQSPSLAQKIRQQLEKQFGPAYAAWVAELGETRKLILASGLDQERKLDLLHSLASREAVEKALAEHGALAGELTAPGERA